MTRIANCSFIDPPSTRLPTSGAWGSAETGPDGVFVADADLGVAFYHMGLPAGMEEEFTLPPIDAKFLVAAGPNTWLTLQCGGYDDAKTKWFEQFNMSVGAPLEPMQKGADGLSFSRRFARAAPASRCWTTPRWSWRPPRGTSRWRMTAQAV